MKRPRAVALLPVMLFCLLAQPLLGTDNKAEKKKTTSTRLAIAGWRTAA